jgi:DNA-directed RNA polymerase specialized sigma24 family protein
VDERSLLESLRVRDPLPEAQAALFKLTLRLAASAARKLPRPGGGEWSPDDISDLTQDIYESGRLTTAILKAEDDEHLAALISTALRRMAIDRIRAADETGLHERVSDVLRNGPFVQHSGAWGPPGFSAGERYQGSESALIQAVWAVPVTILRVRADSKRRSSYASREDFEAMLSAVLGVAQAPVPLRSLVSTCAHRLGQAVTVFDHDADPVAPAGTPEDVLVGQSIAAVLWAQLTSSQRSVVPYLDLSSRQAAAIIGLGHSAVSVAQSAVKAVVANECRELTGGEQLEVVKHLCELHAHDIAAGQTEPMPRGDG